MRISPFKTFTRTAAAALIALLALPGCFTGVESTARIKDTTRRGKQPELTAEQTLLLPALPQAPADWRKGKPFMVGEGRLDLAYSPSTAANALHRGDTIYFQSMTGSVRLAGDSVTDITLSTRDGHSLTHRVESPLSKVIGAERLALPFMVDLDVVGGVRSLLRGKRLWTLRTGRSGRKFDEVRVSDVVAGSADYPLLVITDGDSTAMVAESKSVSARTFDNLFSLSNPRDRYPQIQDDIWDLICRGKIKEGMTRDECRLALGAPDNVERDAAYNGIIERWTYNNGVFLFFTDGLLTRYRL